MDKIDVKVYCPKCGYIISVEEKMYAIDDYLCPICKGNHISEFLTIRRVIEEEL